MSIREIDNENTTKAYPTKGTQTHTNKYVEHLSNKPTTSMREKGTDEYENAHIQVVAAEFSRRRD